MGIDELARTYIAKVERQQHARPTGLFSLIRDTSERAPHFSAGTRSPSTSRGQIHCEECGLLMNGQSICSGCRASPTRLWLQFVSLGTLGVLTAYNYIFVLNFLPTRVPQLIGMESCSGSHFLGRALRDQRHEVRLMPAQYVKPYVHTNKEAIAEAVQRPRIRFVLIKSGEQLDWQALHRVRERWVMRRTAVVNQIRSLLLERGLTLPIE